MKRILAFCVICAAVLVVSRAEVVPGPPTIYVTNARNDGGFEVDAYSEHAARLERRITGLSVYLRGATTPLRRAALPVSGLALGVLARN